MAIDKLGRSKTANSVQELQNHSFDPKFSLNVVEVVGVDNSTTPATANQLAVMPDGSIADGLKIGIFDYVSMALSDGDTTETYTFKTGGSGGTTVATVTVVYTTSDRDVLSSVTKV